MGSVVNQQSASSNQQSAMRNQQQKGHGRLKQQIRTHRREQCWGRRKDARRRCAVRMRARAAARRLVFQLHWTLGGAGGACGARAVGCQSVQPRPGRPGHPLARVPWVVVCVAKLTSPLIHTPPRPALPTQSCRWLCPLLGSALR
jgi:hypothetical protein